MKATGREKDIPANRKPPEQGGNIPNEHPGAATSKAAQHSTQ